jgi:hypothetical protein
MILRSNSSVLSDAPRVVGAALGLNNDDIHVRACVGHRPRFDTTEL